MPGGGWTEYNVWFPPYGCSQMGEDQEHTRAILCGLIRHPNAGAVLVLGLGVRTAALPCCKSGWAAGTASGWLSWSARPWRMSWPRGASAAGAGRPGGSGPAGAGGADELVVGLKCGGSDGLSGITANPLAGRVTDRVIARAAPPRLAEVPEMFGAEGVLFRRCVDEGDRPRPRWWRSSGLLYLATGRWSMRTPRRATRRVGSPPLEEKSLGCVQKGEIHP